MKKMFLLLMTVGVFSAAMAQPRQERRDVVLGQQTGRGGYGGFYGDRDDRYRNDRYSGHSFTSRERDAVIRMINHEFDDRIWAVRRSRYMSQ
ncbi:MAG TPA: hypothetical protein VFR58_12380, partial [Flavisolibacter sp.]|nr:hypothetical protein [Flavisolibacter sp.]